MAITILNWNRKHYSQKTIEHLIKQTTVPYVLILVDNNSAEDSGVGEYLKNVKAPKAQDVIYCNPGVNMGVAGGRNYGIKTALDKYGDRIKWFFNIDDDVLVPADYDKKIVNIFKNIPKVGLVGISVEPFKFPTKVINGVKFMYKAQGNLNGAALCMSRNLFDKAGYYGFGSGTLYGHEDSFMRYKLDMLGLKGFYIDAKGVHLDKDQDKAYRKAKNDAHTKGSMQLRELSKSVAEMRKTGNTYTPYTPPEQYRPVDEVVFTNELIKKG